MSFYVQFSFSAHVALLESFLNHSRHIVDRARFEHSTEWAAKIFSRLMTALDARATHGDALNAAGHHNPRLFVVQEGHTWDSAPGIPAQEHCVTSDLKRALATAATAFPRSQVLSDRKEGRFLASAESDDKWFAVSKGPADDAYFNPHERLVRVDLVQEVSDQTGRPPGRQEPGRYTGDHWPQVIKHDHHDELARLRAQRATNANFSNAPRHAGCDEAHPMSSTLMP
jgi:hypothetical protein